MSKHEKICGEVDGFISELDSARCTIDALESSYFTAETLRQKEKVSKMLQDTIWAAEELFDSLKD